LARTVTLLQLRTWARQLSDTENDPNVTDAELTALANRHMPEVYDDLVAAGPPEYYAASTTVTTVAGQIPYALPSNFLALMDVFVHESSTDRRPIPSMPSGARGRFKAPTTVTDLTVEYIPACPTLSLDADTFDGISGFEELIANLMARDVMIKRQDDATMPLGTIASLRARIVSRARSRNRGEPKRITDLDDAFDNPVTEWTGSNAIACYRLRAGNLELYEGLWSRP